MPDGTGLSRGFLVFFLFNYFKQEKVNQSHIFFVAVTNVSDNFIPRKSSKQLNKVGNSGPREALWSAFVAEGTVIKHHHWDYNRHVHHLNFSD